VEGYSTACSLLTVFQGILLHVLTKYIADVLCQSRSSPTGVPLCRCSMDGNSSQVSFKTFSINDCILEHTHFTIMSATSISVSIGLDSILHFENKIPNTHSTVILALDSLLLNLRLCSVAVCRSYGVIKHVNKG
jgi:hypothetical protein